MAENIGGVSITIEGDYSKLQSDFDAALSVAQTGAGKIGDAIDGAFRDPDTTPIRTAVSDVGEALTQLITSQLQPLRDTLQNAFSAPDDSGLASAIGNVSSLLQQAGSSVDQFAQSILNAWQEGTTLPEAVGAALRDLQDQVTTAEQNVKDTLSQPLPPIDVTASVDSLQTLDDTAQRVGDEIKDDLSQSVPAIDVGPATESIEQMKSSAEGIGPALEDVAKGIGDVGNETGNALPKLQMFSEGAQKIVDAQQKADDELAKAQQNYQEIAAAYDRGAASADALARAQQQVASAFQSANPALQQAKEAADAAKESYGALNEVLGFAGLAVSIGGFVKLAESVGEVTDSFTKSKIALEAVTGSAEQTEEILTKIDALGLQDGLSIPGLQQAAINMQKLLPEGTDVVSVLDRLADASAVTGKGVDTLAQSLDRIVTSTSGPSIKMLNNFGLSFDDLRKAMQDAGADLDSFGGDVKKAFAALDEHDKLAVMQRAIDDLGGTAKKVADETFSGAWHKAVAQFDVDIALVNKDLGSLNSGASGLGDGLKTTVNVVASVFVGMYTLVKTNVDAIIDLTTAMATAISGGMKAVSQAGEGDFKGAWQTVTDSISISSALVAKSWTDIKSDFSAGAKTISDLMNQTSTAIKKPVEDLDGMGKHAKSAAADIAAAFAQVATFEDQVASGAGVKQLQTDFENASKAIDKVAKVDLPAAIEAVNQYTQAQIANNAPANVMAEAFNKQEALIGKLGKEDLPAAEAAARELFGEYANSGKYVSLTNQAFEDEEKLVAQLAKVDLPAAKAAQEDVIATLEKTPHSMAQMNQAFDEYQKILTAMAKDGLPGVIDGFNKLAEEEAKNGEPAQKVTDTLMAEQKVLDDMAKTNLPGAIKGLQDLVDEENKLQQPAQVVIGTLEDIQKQFDTMAKTDLPGAIQGLENLAQKERDLNEPTQVISRTFADAEKQINELAKTDLPAAIQAMDDLAQKERDLNQPAQTVLGTLKDEQKLIQDLGKTDLPGAINAMENLIEKERDLNAPTATVRDTLQAEQKLIMDLGQTNLPTAVQAMQNFIDKQNALKQPAADIAKSFGDEQKLINQLANQDLPAAIDAQQHLIDKMNELKQPTADVQAAYKDLSGMFSKLAQTDLPGASAGFQALVDKMNALKSPAKDIQSVMGDWENTVTDLANRSLPGANKALDDFIAELQKVPGAFKDIQAQQEIAIAKDQQMLDMMQKAGDGYGYILDQQGKVLQEEIAYAEKTGQDASTMIYNLEAIKLKQEVLKDETHGLADTYVAMFEDINKGFGQMAQAMADAIVNAKNLGDAMVGVFKKIAQSILTDLIAGALKPLEDELKKAEASLFKMLGGGSNSGSGDFGGEYGPAVPVPPAGGKGGSTTPSGGGGGDTSGSGGSGGGSGTASTVGAIGAVAGAIAAAVGDVYLAAISSKLFNIQTSLLAIQNDTANSRKDAWDQFGAMYTRLGECKNDLDKIADEIAQLKVEGGGFPDQALTDLNDIAAAARQQFTLLPTMQGALQTIASDIINGIQDIEMNYLSVIVQKLGELVTSGYTTQSDMANLATAQDVAAASSDITGAVADTTDAVSSVSDAVSSAASDASQSAADISDAITTTSDQLGTTLESASSDMVAAVGATTAAVTSTSQAVIGAYSDTANAISKPIVDSIDRSSQENTAQLLKQLAVDQQIADQGGNTVSQVKALQDELKDYQGLIDQAIKDGNTKLAAVYQQAADQIASKIDQVTRSGQIVADHINALKDEIKVDTQLMNDAIAKGDLDLADKYRQAAANVQSELLPLLSATATYTGDAANTLNTLQNTLGKDIQGVGFAATSAGVMVSAHVDAAAVSIGTAVAQAVASVGFMSQGNASTGGGTTTPVNTAAGQKNTGMPPPIGNPPGGSPTTGQPGFTPGTLPSSNEIPTPTGTPTAKPGGTNPTSATVATPGAGTPVGSQPPPEPSNAYDFSEGVIPPQAAPSSANLPPLKGGPTLPSGSSTSSGASSGTSSGSSLAKLQEQLLAAQTTMANDMKKVADAIASGAPKDIITALQTIAQQDALAVQKLKDEIAKASDTATSNMQSLQQQLLAAQTKLTDDLKKISDAQAAGMSADIIAAFQKQAQQDLATVNSLKDQIAKATADAVSSSLPSLSSGLSTHPGLIGAPISGGTSQQTAAALGDPTAILAISNAAKQAQQLAAALGDPTAILAISGHGGSSSTGTSTNAGSSPSSAPSGPTLDPQTLGFYAATDAELEDIRNTIHAEKEILYSMRDSWVAFQSTAVQFDQTFLNQFTAFGKALIASMGHDGAQLPSYDLGGSVPRDMIARLHAGEHVIQPTGPVMLPDAILKRLQLPDVGGSNLGPLGSPGPGQRDSSPMIIQMTNHFNGIVNPEQLCEAINKQIKLVIPRSGGVGTR